MRCGTLEAIPVGSSAVQPADERNSARRKRLELEMERLAGAAPVISTPLEVQPEEAEGRFRERNEVVKSEAQKPEANGTFTLGALSLGTEAVVVRLNGSASSRIKLCTIGVVPGAPLVLEKLKPAVVFRMGRSRFAVDRELGDSIEVRPV